MLPATVPLACFLSVIRPPWIQYEDAVLQIAPVEKSMCPFIKDGNDISFQLFTRHNPTAHQELKLGDDESLFASHLDFHAPTVLYFHAFMERPSDSSGLMVREAYMQRPVNVIMVNARQLEAGPWYFTAAQNTWYIGRYAAQFIDYLVSRGLDLNNTHLVGHSLGAQAAGVAGSAVHSGRVSRITGLDPALPLFSGLPLEQRLDSSDAQFVDVIHTDAGIFGVKEPVGHVDFYPNGGQSPQPGCELEVVIPQKMLLNKCDGSEQTNGFYTFYITPYQLIKHSQRNPDTTASSQTVTNTAEQEITQKHEERNDEPNITQLKVNKKYHNDIDIKPVDNDSFSRKKRIERDVIETKDEKDGGQYLPHENGNTAFSNDNTDKLHHGNHEVSTDNRANTNDDIIKVFKISYNDNRQNVTTITRNNNITISVLSNINNGITINQKQKNIAPLKSRITKRNEPRNRQKRFLNFFKSDKSNENSKFKVLQFLFNYGKKVLPVISVVREINTLVKSANGVLNHMTKETNKYIGETPPPLSPISYTVELGTDKGLVAFIKKVLGLGAKGDKLTITSK